MSIMRSFGVALVLAATCACAGQGSSAGSPASGRLNPSLITVEELRDPSLAGQSVLEVVRKLRPNFLSSRGVQSRNNPQSGQVHASINGVGVVSVEELRSMVLAGVVEIRLLSAAAAMQRFGGAAQEGPVILVITM